MSRIVLATLNARFSHAALGLRYLLANMGELRGETALHEYVISDNTVDVVASLLAENPEIVGLGVYIWNVDQMTRVVTELKQLRPDIVVVLGGPEVSYESETQPLVALSDFVISGEGDLAFPELCRALFAGQPPETRFIQPPVPALSEVRLPYDLYSDEDIACRTIYVEVSRGCPFTCEFCLSALEIPVRLFDVEEFLAAMQTLLDRGANQFKFVDRTFNLNLRVSESILQFFLDRIRPEMFLHFEMIPDRLPDALRQLIARFPPGSLQFEIGVQTFNDDVGALISRRQNNEQLEDNFRFLRGSTGVHIHADLIVGLPGESLESFAAGFDRLFALRPQEIQIGILKRLKGTPITRHDQEWQMVYSRSPPFEILRTRLMSFEQIHEMRRLARYWDMIGNSGNFTGTLPLLVEHGESAFQCFSEFCRWLYDREQRAHGISLVRLMQRVFEFLVQSSITDELTAAETLLRDYQRIGRRDIPGFLRRFPLQRPGPPRQEPLLAPARQRRHLAE